MLPWLPGDAGYGQTLLPVVFIPSNGKVERSDLGRSVEAGRRGKERAALEDLFLPGLIPSFHDDDEDEAMRCDAPQILDSTRLATLKLLVP